MSWTQTLLSRKARQASRSSLGLESLEPRLALYAPGGNVTAQLLGSTLLLTGDAFDNTLVVASATGGRMAVIGAPGTTINGADAMVTPFVTNRAVTSIVATLNGGNDVIGFTNDAIGLSRQIWFSDVSVPFSTGDLQAVLDTVAPGVTAFTLPRSLTVTTGAGNDFVGIIGDVGGSIAANLGSALSGPTNRNTFTIGDPLVSSVVNRVGGSVSVVGGDQNDVSLINGTDVGGVVAYALGNGRNGGTVNGDRPTLGSFAYTGGTGDDVVSLTNPITVRNGVSVFTGPQGKDEFALFNNATVGGSVLVNTGAGADDDFVEVRAPIRGGLSVITGAGNDQIYVESTIGGGLAINPGAGDDYVECSNTSVALNTVIDVGVGDDRVVSSGLTTRYNLFVYLGPGNDTLTLGNSRALAAFLYGGTGTNTLNIDPATRTGIRTLRWFQFQTVNFFQ